tara:strand:- start:8662 stop:10644 length:1983 start_codon:yes stop_codon:yes gene_type:complete
MSVAVERYTEEWNGNTYSRVAFIFPYNNEAKDALKAALPFPATKWDGVRKGWGVRDTPADLQTAVETLAPFYHFAPLVDELPVVESPPLAKFSAPDAIILDYPFQPNWKQINAAVKSLGNANFNMQTKVWSIPLNTAHQIANAVEAHYAELAQAIRDLPEVAGHVEAAVERVSLSQAVALENETPVRERVALTQGEPFPHQWVAPAMFIAGDQHRLLIADEPGLGKTLQALLCIDAAQFSSTLIVCPANVKYTWLNECEKWYTWHSRQVVKNGKDTIEAGKSFTIINYELLTKREEELKSLDFDCIVFDESHYLKNEKAERTKVSVRLANWPTVKGLICLSGTPILNRPAEFYNVLKMLMPGSFANWFDFVKKYAAGYKGTYAWVTTGATNIDKCEDGVTIPLNHLLRDLMLRRTYDDKGIAESMPDLVQTTVLLPLTEVQRATYDADYDRWMEEYDRLNALGALPQGYALELLTALRHLCGQMKVTHAVDWAKDYHEQTGKPLVIFAHHLDIIGNIYTRLVASSNNYRVSKITGATPSEDRQRLVDEFQAGDLDFLVCSTLAAKEGITLTNADTTLFVEREWVPAWEQQAAHRVRRMSQESSVCHQVILSAQNCIDEHFDKVVSAKAAIVKRALDGDAEERAQGDIVKSLLASLTGVSA